MLRDGTWYFKEGTVFILEPIGWIVDCQAPSFNTNSQYINTECIRLNKVIYNNLINFNTDEYEITELEQNVINPIFKYTYTIGNGNALANYKVEKYTSLEILENQFGERDKLFEEAIGYIRDEKITNLLD